MPQYTLIYFNITGLGEVPRLLFAQAGVEYEDRRIPSPWLEPDVWPKLKKETPFQKLPILEIDGKPIAQSQAIVQYLAREFGLEGKDNLGMAKVYEAYYMSYDILINDFKQRYEKNETKKQEVKENLITAEFPRLLDALKTILGDNDFLAGGTVSVADMIAFVAVQRLQGLNWPEVDNLLKAYPTVTALQDRVAKSPNIAAYLEKRPKTKY
ncbi:hematopoietic prostaglandin D synthase-like [Tubulanus polymorphus]|uniref:hematopoietic prostaglandin D synthase-like n=1 Tax=Tubulanus polymorphus TaxID=672921 RepID=UPI003DA23D5F